MVVAAVTDMVVSAHCPLVDLCCACLSACTENLFLLCCRLDDSGKLFLLGLEVIIPYGDLLLHHLELVLLVEDTLLGLGDVLLRDLPEKSDILDLLVQRVLLTAVCNILELLPVLFDLVVALGDVVLVLCDELCVLLSHL